MQFFLYFAREWQRQVGNLERGMGISFPRLVFVGVVCVTLLLLLAPKAGLILIASLCGVGAYQIFARR
jgi:hypothetical protein